MLQLCHARHAALHLTYCRLWLLALGCRDFNVQEEMQRLLFYGYNLHYNLQPEKCCLWLHLSGCSDIHESQSDVTAICQLETSLAPLYNPKFQKCNPPPQNVSALCCTTLQRRLTSKISKKERYNCKDNITSAGGAGNLLLFSRFSEAHPQYFPHLMTKH